MIGFTGKEIATTVTNSTVTYHKTVVFRRSFIAGGYAITLDSGGWRTKTTKKRMNQAAKEFGINFRVFSKNYDWYITLPNRKTVEFTDGMSFDTNGEWVAR